MTTRTEHLLWVLAGGLSFLVLGFGYRLLTPASPPVFVLLPIAVVVGLLGAGLAHALRPYLVPERPAE